MLPSNQWSYQDPYPFDILTASGVPEVFSYAEPSANQATADFICLWENRYDVVRHLLGTGVYNQGPIVHPTRTDLFAKRAVITGMYSNGFDGSWATYEFARINVTFQVQPSGSIGGGGGGSFITVDTEAAGEYMTLPGRALKWDAGAPNDAGKALIEPQQIFIPKKAHKVTVHQWTFPPFDAMDAAVGHANAGSVTWIGRTIGAQRLLFENYHENVDVYLFGIPTYKVEMTFLEKARSWNYFPHINGAGLTWQLVDPLPFETANFGGIFP